MKRTLLMTGLFLAACNNVSSVDKTDADTNKDAAIVETTADNDIEFLRLYALECGRIDMLDLSLFDKGGAFDGRTNKAVDSCYLLRHPKGDLLWDTGLPDAINAMKDGVTEGPFHIAVPTTLSSQLTTIGIAPKDIEYLSLSHSHFDHVGNAGTYAGSTLLANKAEYAHMFRDGARKDAQSFAAYGAIEKSEVVKFTGKYDVFGDGSVMIIDMPGHTPGHTVLQVNLAKSGTILLTGDLYHLGESREKRTVPVFNTDADETLRSMDKFEELAKNTNTRVIIQHSMKDFESLPKPPEYLD